MQQYFVCEELNVNKTISLNEDIVFHLTKVLRNSENSFRLCDINGRIFLARLENNKAFIFESLDENNELEHDVTALISIIKQDKFEIILQKLCELGVKRIVPVITAYSQDLIFTDNRITRFNKILKEAAEQSHRNFVPELLSPIKLSEISNYLSDINIVPYEKSLDKFDIDINNKTISFIIGPEGGFKKEEIDYLKNNSFVDTSLGKRILRAETAAITMMSYILKDIQ